MIDSQNKFHQIISEFIHIKNEYIKEIDINIIKCISPQNAAQEWLTIRINGPRGLGKSEYINKYLTKNDLAVFPSDRHMNWSTNTDGKLISIVHIDKVLPLHNYNIIYIDEAGFLNLDLIYNKITKMNLNQTFVLLG